MKGATPAEFGVIVCDYGQCRTRSTTKTKTKAEIQRKLYAELAYIPYRMRDAFLDKVIKIVHNNYGDK
jgi:hypothetical protein